MILGGGRVGRAAARALTERSVPFRVVERIPERVRHLAPETVVVGDASDLDVLRAAGLDDASAVMVTTHDDDTNVFLTFYCRRLREDLEILGRARVDRNVFTLQPGGSRFRALLCRHRCDRDRLKVGAVTGGTHRACRAVPGLATVAAGDGDVVVVLVPGEVVGFSTDRAFDVECHRDYPSSGRHFGQ